MSVENDAAFRSTFASFLRRHGDAWRMRRRDYMVPLDFHLARRQITLQGQIDPELITLYLEEQGEDVPPPEGFVEGEPTLIYLPFAALPKKVLLDFTTFDAKGARLPLLTRSQGSALTADHLYLLLTRGRLAKLRDEQLRAAALLTLQAFAAINPGALRKEIDQWVDASWKIDEPGRFRRWFMDQLTAFDTDMRTSSTTRFANQAETLRLSNPIVSFDGAPEHALDDTSFASAGEMVFWGVREFIHGLLDIHDPARASRPNIPALRAGLESYLASGVVALNELRLKLEEYGANDPAAKALLHAFDAEMRTAAVSWMAYVSAPIRVGEPFHFRTSELLPLRQIAAAKKRGLSRWLATQKIRVETNHAYRVYPVDARSFHVEIATEDPNLVIGSTNTWIKNDGKFRRPGELFHQEYQESEHIAHFYTSSSPTEAPFRDIGGPIQVIVRFNLPTAVVVGYGIAALAVAGDLVWSTHEWLFSHPDQPTRLGLLTVGVGFLGVALFFLSAQDIKPLVRGKIEVLRFGVYAALALLVLEPFWSWWRRHR